MGWTAAGILPCFLLFALQASAYRPGVKRIYYKKHAVTRNVVSEPLNITCGNPICDGPLAPIYCHGAIVTTAWQFGLYAECPAEKLRFPPETVVENFNKLTFPIGIDEFKHFCASNFEHLHYLEPADLTDWKAEPSIIDALKNPNYKKLAVEINNRWKVLGRRFVADAHVNPLLYPVLPVPKPFIVPGGQFDMYFYWDSYWVIKGLLLSGMNETARGMIENFASIVNARGFIPNSGNIHLSKRSQPPLFTQMVADYYRVTSNLTFLREMLPVVDKELSFWESTRQTKLTAAKDGKSYAVFQYKAPSTCPRPENLLVDYANGMNGSFPSEFIWSSIASGCESGWDFSSRWFEHGGKQGYSKFAIHTNDIVPLDLNVFMTWNYRTMATLYSNVDNKTALAYQQKFASGLATMDLFWDEEEGMWFDYDGRNNSLVKSFYPTNVYPLLVVKSNGDVVGRVADYLNRNKVLTFPGGLPTTLPVPSHEQWDFPNVWAPTVHLFVMSLLASRDAYLTKAGKDEAEKFIATVYKGVFSPPEGTKPGIWEKYDAQKSDGSHGGGGEYPVQEGFGWTNGAVLDLMFVFDGTFAHIDQTAKDHNITTTSDPGMDFLGGPPHSVIIVSLVGFCFFIALTFSLFMIRNAKRPRDAVRRSPTHSASRQRLLNDSEEE